MSDINSQRDFVAGLYSGPGWKAKVAKMPDDQVRAIYLGKHNKAPEKPPEPTIEERGSDDSS